VNIYDVRARVAASLFDVSAVERVRAARTLVRAGTSEADNQAQLAAGAAAVAYLRVQRAQAQLANRAADSALAGELVGIARQQLRAGTGVGLDVTRARSQFAGTRAALIAARGERDRARLDLARALGVPLDAPLALADTLGAPADTVVPGAEQAVRAALGRRADLRAAAEQLDAARGQAAAIRAERLPSVQAFVDDGQTGTGPAHLLNTYTYGVQVNVPIFDAGRRGGRLEEQQAAASELDVRRRDLEVQAAVDVRGALVDLRTAGEQAAAARERLTLAEQEVAQARDRFRAGVAGNADVITASQSLTAARTGYADALAARQSARVALARAQGAVTDLP
jgi:outer membrane protein TolC